MEGKRINIPGKVEFTFNVKDPSSKKRIESGMRSSEGLIEGENDSLIYSQCWFFSDCGQIKLTFFDVKFDSNNPRIKNSAISNEERISVCKEEIRKFIQIEVISKFDN